MENSEKTAKDVQPVSDDTKLGIGASDDIDGLELTDQNRYVLSEAQMDQLLKAMEAEPKDVSALKELFARKSIFE